VNLKEEASELKYQYEKSLRVKTNLEKNLERRKKLNLLDSFEEDSLLRDIAEADRQAEDYRRKMRALESQLSRSRIISESKENAMAWFYGGKVFQKK
jgi:uncharacterized radical SAM superfamily protein